jgi:hypothetical protein
MRSTFCQLTRLSVLALLLGPLFAGCFKHPTPGTACTSDDNCRKNQECVVSDDGGMGTCQEARDADAGTDVGPRPDGAAESAAEIQPDAKDVSEQETDGAPDLAPATPDGGNAAEVLSPVDLASTGMDGEAAPDGFVPTDIRPVNVDGSDLADGMTLLDLAPPAIDAPVTTPDSGVDAVDSAGLPPSPDAPEDTQPQIDTPPDGVGPFTISVSVGGSGRGSVTSNLAGIDCPGDCSEAYPAGTQVQLTATIAAGVVFAGWTGAGCGNTNPCTVTLDGPTSVIATFNMGTQTLTVGHSGDGSGRVRSDPTGIDCGTACSHDFTTWTHVILTATGSLTSVFTGWSGDCAGSATTCTVIMSAARSVTAAFKAVTPLTCTTSPSAQSCAGGSIPDINLGSGLDAQTCHDRCQLELAADGATTGCWIVGANGECLCRGGALSDLQDNLYPGGGCTGSVGNITCGSLANTVACTESASDDDLGGAYTAAECKSLCEQRLNARSNSKGCWLRTAAHCWCRIGDIILGYSGGSCTAP